ncbi:MAG: FAD-dependent oxidoreductase [Bryobacter sp.]
MSFRHEVSLFEKVERLGGHTHTHRIATSAGLLPIDSGFIVHNDRTYPNLIRLFAELGLERLESEMSWGVTTSGYGFEYSSNGLSGFFAQRRNLVNPQHWKLLADIVRFNREALALADSGKADSMMLGPFLEQRGYGEAFLNKYLYPTVAAIWSTAPRRVLEFPALTLIRFFDNHGLLTLQGHPTWKVLRGGSSVYIEKLIQPLGSRVYTNAAITGLRRLDDGRVALQPMGQSEIIFDRVVIACHGPQALALLSDASAQEREILAAFQTSTNQAILHTDERLLPRREAARASWNYLLSSDPQSPAMLTYDMNRLQRLPTRERYLVSLNAKSRIDPALILREMEYQHPLYTLAAIRAQGRWEEISGTRGVYFCGAYWRYGFHEDGYWSALRVARQLGVPCEIN